MWITLGGAPAGLFGAAMKPHQKKTGRMTIKFFYTGRSLSTISKKIGFVDNLWITRKLVAFCANRRLKSVSLVDWAWNPVIIRVENAQGIRSRPFAAKGDFIGTEAG
jgi:hypothetical protein